PDRILLFVIHDDGEGDIVPVEDHHARLLLLTSDSDELRVMQLRMTVKRIPPSQVFNLSKVTLRRRHNIRMRYSLNVFRPLIGRPRPLVIHRRSVDMISQLNATELRRRPKRAQTSSQGSTRSL